MAIIVKSMSVLKWENAFDWWLVKLFICKAKCGKMVPVPKHCIGLLTLTHQCVLVLVVAGQGAGWQLWVRYHKPKRLDTNWFNLSQYVVLIFIFF